MKCGTASDSGSVRLALRNGYVGPTASCVEANSAQVVLTSRSTKSLRVRTKSRNRLPVTDGNGLTIDTASERDATDLEVSN